MHIEGNLKDEPKKAMKLLKKKHLHRYFYKDDYFESVVAINLTTMLVIVTLFVSVSSDKNNSIKRIVFELK